MTNYRLFSIRIDFYLLPRKCNYIAGRSEDLWMKARSAQFTLLIPTGIYISLSTVTLIRMDWAIYSTFVLNWLGVTAFFSYAIAFIPTV